MNAEAVGSLELLAREARLSGHTFLDRFIDDWRTGTNRFDGPGECLLGVFNGNTLVGVGGLNRDPYNTSGRAIGRLRHVYVAQSHRRYGLGQQLVTALLARACAFERIHLRTPGTPEAAAFYESLGFVAVDEPDATHALETGHRALKRQSIVAVSQSNFQRRGNGLSATQCGKCDAGTTSPVSG